MIATRKFARCSFVKLVLSRQSTASADSFVDASNAPANWDPESAVVYPAVIVEDQAEVLVQLLIEKFKRHVERSAEILLVTFAHPLPLTNSLLSYCVVQSPL